jgi:hypothetical protein
MKKLNRKPSKYKKISIYVDEEGNIEFYEPFLYSNKFLKCMLKYANIKFKT